MQQIEKIKSRIMSKIIIPLSRAHPHLNLQSSSLGFVEGYLFFPATINSSFLPLLSSNPTPTLFIFPLSPEILADWGLPYDTIGFFSSSFFLVILLLLVASFVASFVSQGDLKDVSQNKFFLGYIFGPRIWFYKRYLLSDEYGRVRWDFYFYAFLSVVMKLFTVTCTMLPFIVLMKLLSFLLLANESVATNFYSILGSSQSYTGFSHPFNIDFNLFPQEGLFSFESLNLFIVDDMALEVLLQFVGLFWMTATQPHSIRFLVDFGGYFNATYTILALKQVFLNNTYSSFLQSFQLPDSVYIAIIRFSSYCN